MGSSSNPKIFAQLLAAAGKVALDPFRILIVGQVGSDGTAVDGKEYQDVQSLTNTEVKTLFGTIGELTNRILRARDYSNGRFPIWVIGKTAVAGTAATAALLVGGTATESKTMRIKPIDSNNFAFNVDIISGEAAAAVATKIKAGFDNLVAFPATNALATATITLTADDSGTLANKFVVESKDIPAGITINTNAGEDRVQFTGGATDPTLTGIFDNVESIRFHSISWPWDNAYTEVKTFLEARNVINNAFLHGMAFIGLDDTEANIHTKLNGATPENSPNLVFMGNRQLLSESVTVTPPDWRCVEFMSIEALRQTPDVPLGQYITTSAPLDAFGGPGLASLAYYNTPMNKTDITLPDLLFDGEEQIRLEKDGYTVVGVNESTTSMIMGPVVSTYKFNTLGQDDPSFKYLNYIRTGFLALEFYYRTLKANYSQFRLTEGDVIPGRAMVNKEGIEAEYTRIFKVLGGPDYVLCQAGTGAESFFFQNLSISTDLSTGKVTSSGQLPIVTQVRQFNITFQLSFSIGG